jgi:hypothetical protein
MKQYSIVRTIKLENGEEYHKWVPGPSYYQWSAEYLIAQIEKEPKNFDYLLVPFILTLSSSLEASLNDWILIDTFNKHGPQSYIPIAQGYIYKKPFKEKLRLAVKVMTEEYFYLNESSPIVKKLDELIAARNKITHPQTLFFRKISKANKLPTGTIQKHPLWYLTQEKCKDYYVAVTDFDRLFFKQYDEGKIYENEILYAQNGASEN